MSSTDYDLDSSGGLMPKIQALIAPPESDETSKANKKKEGLDLHPYYKRPGKGHNRDCCDACSEGGNLICCDKCPASFHLACHDPPLDDEDIPLGQWLCHKCRMTAGLPPLKQILGERRKTEKEIVCDTQEAPSKDEPTTDTPTRGRSRTSSTASMESNKSRGRGRAAAAAAAATATSAPSPAVPSSPMATSSVAAGPDNASALETLIAAASSMNPKQFDLPREMVLPINFPGTDRAPTRGRKASAAKRSRTLELDNGLVPLPAKTCFECRKSCKRAPLLACDYCPLLFHLDCLDPPLTSLPSGRWMCPNHVEQAIDEKLLTSLSVTQRVALWDKYTGPIDQETVKTEFLQKTRRQNPPFRFKVKLAPRNRAKVPNAVKEMYKNRPPLIPTLRDVLREKEISARLSENFGNFPAADNNVRLDGPTETEQEEWLSGIIALQTSIACHLSSKKRKKSDLSDNSQIHEVKTEVQCDEDRDRKTTESKSFSRQSSTESSNTVGNYLSNGMLGDDEHIGIDEDDIEVSKYNATDVLNGASCKKYTHMSSKIFNGDAQSVGGMCDESSDLTTNVSTSAFQRNEDAKRFKRLCTNRTRIEGLSNLLQDSLDASIPEESVDKLDERLIRLLALQRLQQLTSDPKLLPDGLTSTSKAPTFMLPRQPTFWPACDSGLQPRALLTPLNGSQPPMPMYYRVLEIGTGGDMDVCLSYYGHCNYVTAKHAVIICDEVNRHYELMNYSEHGTTVDNVLYSCDFSEKTQVKDQPQSPPPNPLHHGRRSGGGGAAAGGSNTNASETPEVEVEVPPLIQKIRAVVDKRRGVVREEDVIQEPSKMPANIGKVNMKCSCRSSSSSLIGGSGAGWEGTALLNHGSYIKFGCIQFTFSILNYVARPQTEPLPQECAVVTSDGKGPIPSRILKRERDSTSSSTLTVSPSPPPEKIIQNMSNSKALQLPRKEHNEDDDVNGDTEGEENYGDEDEEDEDEYDNVDEEGSEMCLDTMEVQDGATEDTIDQDSLLLPSNSVQSSSRPDLTNCVSTS